MSTRTARMSLRRRRSAGTSVPELRTNLLVYYKFEADGTDSHDGGFDLTEVNTPTYVPAEVGNGANLAVASSQYFTNSSFDGLDSVSAFTIMCFIKLTTKNPFASIGSQKDADEEWLLNSTGANTNYRLKIAGNQTATDAEIFSTGTMYHFRVQYDGTEGAQADRIKFWVDGVEITAKTVTGTIPSTMPTTENALAIGNTLDNVRLFDGIIDEFGIWDTTLTDSQADLHRLATGLPY